VGLTIHEADRYSFFVKPLLNILALLSNVRHTVMLKWIGIGAGVVVGAGVGIVAAPNVAVATLAYFGTKATACTACFVAGKVVEGATIAGCATGYSLQYGAAGYVLDKVFGFDF
jgi:hypothetical protein